MGTNFDVGSDTFILFSPPTFVEGLAALVDVIGASISYKNVSPNESLVDYRAITSDWHAVGEDLRAAIKEYRQLLEAQLITE